MPQPISSSFSLDGGANDSAALCVLQNFSRLGRPDTEGGVDNGDEPLVLAADLAAANARTAIAVLQLAFAVVTNLQGLPESRQHLVRKLDVCSRDAAETLDHLMPSSLRASLTAWPP